MWHTDRLRDKWYTGVPWTVVYVMLHGTFTVVHILFVYSTQYVDIHTCYLDIPTPCLDIPTPCLDICTHTREFPYIQQSWVSSSVLLAGVSISSVLQPSKEAACCNTLCLCDQLLETGLPTLESCYMSCRARAARALVIHGLECCLFLQCTCCIHLDHSLYGSKS